MIIYISMLLWVPLIYFVYSMGNKEDILLTEYNLRQGTQKKVPIVYAVIAFAYIIFWASIRTYLFDTSAYIASFNNIPSGFNAAWSTISWDGKSVGFDIFNVLFKSFISSDFTLWLSTIAIISGFFIMKTLRKYSPDFFFSLFLFISLTTFTWLFNGMRQFLAVSILFACTELLIKGRTVPFFAIVLLVATVHITALFMIPVYFIARAKPWSMMIAFSVLGIIVICIFAEPFFSGFETVISGNTAYGGFMDQFAEDDGVNPIRVLFYAAFPILAFINREKLDIYSENNKLISICVNMSVITAAVYFVGMFTSGILIGRIPIYCELYNYILIPYILYIAFDKDERKIAKAAIVIVSLLFFFLMCPGVYVSNLTGFIFS